MGLKIAEIFLLVSIVVSPVIVVVAVVWAFIALMRRLKKGGQPQRTPSQRSSTSGFLESPLRETTSSFREVDVKRPQTQDLSAERGRFSAKQKKEAVLRGLKGEDFEALSRELDVTMAVLSEWREKFLAGAEARLESREPEPADDEVLRLKAMVGDLMMKNELLAEKARLLESNAQGVPARKSKG